MKSIIKIATVLLAILVTGCRGACITHTPDTQCWDDQSEVECTTAGTDYDWYEGMSCADFGYTALSGEPGGEGGATGCGTDPYGSCDDVWLGSPDDQAMYNCLAACAEESACNQAGIDANCDILSAYGSSSFNACTTCTGSSGTPTSDADDTCMRQCSSDASCNSGECCLDTAEAGDICLPCSCQGCWNNGQQCSYYTDSCDFDQCY